MSFPTFPLFVILHEGHPCPKLQNPMLSKAVKNLILWEKVTVGADEGWWKTRIPGPDSPSATIPLSRRSRVNGSIMDSATPPYGCAQNDSIA